MQYEQIKLKQKKNIDERNIKNHDIISYRKDELIKDNYRKSLLDIIDLKDIEIELKKLKLSQNEVRVYLYLALSGDQKAITITNNLNIHRTETYNILNRLESQGLISKILERPMRFVAIPFENLLNNKIQERKQIINQMEHRKEELLKIWRSIPKSHNVNKIKETFQVLEGKKHLYGLLMQIIDKSKNTLKIVINDKTLIWLYNMSILDNVDKIAEIKGIKVRLLTNYSVNSAYVFDKSDIKSIDYAYIKDKEVPGYCICDDKEMILFLNNDAEKIVGICTNYKAILKNHNVLFDLLWESIR